MSRAKPRKRKRRHVPTRNPADPGNWALVCRECRQEFHSNTTVGVAAAHYRQLHPGAYAQLEDDSDVHLELVWKGVGPAPKGRP